MTELQDHFSDEDWTDFVRGVISTEKQDQIRQHLAQDCASCRSQYSMWSQVARTTSREPEYQVPESAVRYVENAFTSTQMSWSPSSPTELALLVFDTLNGMVPAGVRGAGSPRHLLYETADFLVDLQIARAGDQDACVIIGHVATREGAKGSTTATRAFLIDRNNTVLRQTTADEVGGFQLESECLGDFKVLLNVPSATIIEIPLPSLNG
jgi:hypothetical protein